MVACNDATDATGNKNQNNSSIIVTTSDSLYKAVMKGHDEAMLKMGAITRYKKILQDSLDAIATLKKPVSDLKLSYKKALDDLTYADELMTQWMVEFDPNLAGEAEEQKVAYYTREKEKVDTVASRINSSIQQASQLVEP